MVGHVWKGRVENVLAGMEAAFIDIGLEKNGFLHVDEVVAMGVPKRKRQIAELLKKGDEILVQATKDPMGTKGARLTMQLSLAGRFLVYVPFGEGVGVSKRLVRRRAPRACARSATRCRSRRRRAHRAHRRRRRVGARDRRATSPS